MRGRVKLYQSVTVGWINFVVSISLTVVPEKDHAPTLREKTKPAKSMKDLSLKLSARKTGKNITILSFLALFKVSTVQFLYYELTVKIMRNTFINLVGRDWLGYPEENNRRIKYSSEM